MHALCTHSNLFRQKMLNAESWYIHIRMVFAVCMYAHCYRLAASSLPPEAQRQQVQCSNDVQLSGSLFYFSLQEILCMYTLHCLSVQRSRLAAGVLPCESRIQRIHTCQCGAHAHQSAHKRTHTRTDASMHAHALCTYVTHYKWSHASMPAIIYINTLAHTKLDKSTSTRQRTPAHAHVYVHSRTYARAPSHASNPAHALTHSHTHSHTHKREGTHTSV